MKTKKLLILLCLALVLSTALMLFGCNKDDTPNTKDPDDTQKQDPPTSVEKVTVTFMNGDTEFSKVEIERGTAVSAPATNPTSSKNNQEFRAWQLDGEDYDFTAAVDADMTLTAAYDTVYTITFLEGETTVKTLKVKKGEKIAEADVPTATDKTSEGLAFKAWMNGTVALYLGDSVLGDASYTAKYEPITYTVRFLNAADNSVLSTVDVDHGAKVPAYTAEIGYRVVSVKLSGADYNYDTAVTSSFDLIVTLEKAKVTVTFTGEVSKSVEIPLGGSVPYATLLEQLGTPEEGYFWSLDLSKLVNVAENVSVAVTKIATSEYRAYGDTNFVLTNANLTDEVKTRYSVDIASYEDPATRAGKLRNWGYVMWQEGQYVEFKADLAGKIMFNFNADKAGQHFTLGLYIDGYLFAEKTINAVENVKWTVENIPAGQHTVRVSIDSVWTDEGGEPFGEWAGLTISMATLQEVQPKNVTVTFQDGAGNVFTTATVKRNTAVTAPETTPTKQYYLFKEWQTSDGKAYDFTAVVAADMTLTAVFERDPAYVLVTFKNGDATYAETFVAVNGQVTKPETDPTKEGYVFRFWSKDGTTAYDFTAAVAKDTTLTAVWKADQPEYTVTFKDADGNTIGSPVTVLQGKDATFPTPPTGYFYTATAEEYAKAFNVTENRTITLGSAATSTYPAKKYWINNTAGADSLKAAMDSYDFDHWSIGNGPQATNNYFTLTGNIGGLSLNFYTNAGASCKFEVRIDGHLTYTYERDNTGSTSAINEMIDLVDGHTPAGQHTITVTLVEGSSHITAVKISAAPKTTTP